MTTAAPASKAPDRRADGVPYDVPYDVIVVGGGIAGLVVTYDLVQRGCRPLLLEAAPRVGGVIVSERVDGYVIDGGPDSLLAQKPAAVTLCRELGLGPRLLPTLPPRTAYVLRDSQLLPLPTGSVLGLPTRLRSLVSSPLFTWAGKLRMAAEVWQPVADTADESIASFMTRRFGREALDYVAEPLLAGIHAGDVDQLSMHALFPRLPQLERAHGSVLRGLRAATARESERGGVTPAAFVSLPTGLAELTEALETRVREHVRCHSAVSDVTRDGTYRVTLQDGEHVRAPRVVLATPAWETARLLRGLDEGLAALCANIPYTSTASVLLAFPRECVAHPLSGTGFVVPRREGRRLTAATWVTSKWPDRAPAGRVLLRAFLGGSRDPTVLDRTDDSLIALACAELAPLLGLRGTPVLRRVFRWRDATPQYLVGHAARVDAIERALSRHEGLHLTGSGFRGTGIPDCIADARQTAATIMPTVSA